MQHLNIPIKVNIDINSMHNTMILIHTPHLKLRSETVVFDLHFTHLVMNYCLDEGLDTELEIAGSQ